MIGRVITRQPPRPFALEAAAALAVTLSVSLSIEFAAGLRDSEQKVCAFARVPATRNRV